jgi:hypothetical protein
MEGYPGCLGNYEFARLDARNYNPSAPLCGHTKISWSTGKMTIDQLIAEVAAKPTQVEAFKTFLACLKIELDDATVGDTPPPSVTSKYGSIFSTATGKANEILTAIENGKPALDPVAKTVVSPSDPSGPHSAHTSTVFVDKPATVVPGVSTTNATSGIPPLFGTAAPAPAPALV